MPARPMPFPPGTILVGKYRIERLLGEGGMGWVVEATHVQLEQRVAVKFMHAMDASASTEAVGRFLREARAAARIQSEHVARVSDFGTLENGAPYLVMEYLEGEDLESLLRRKGALPTELVVDYAMQACEGLAEAHVAGIVHRDLKPANLFLTRRNDGSVRVKLLDFGISKLAAPGGIASSMTSTQALMGSPLYMAPEQMRSTKNVDARADIWSMGVILYEMLGGRPPFDGETLPIVCARIMTESPPPLREVVLGVPPGLEAIVMRCLERDPQQRFQDVSALASALSSLGTAEARIVAGRIGRVVRASSTSLPDASLPDANDAAVAPRTFAATKATFSKTGNASISRPGSRATIVVIGGAAAFAIALGVIGVVALRGGSKAETTSAAAQAAVVSTATATPTPAPTPTPIPTATATATATATPTQAPSASIASKPKSSLQPRPAPAPKGAGGTPKPASTSAFGGRD